MAEIYADKKKYPGTYRYQHELMRPGFKYKNQLLVGFALFVLGVSVAVGMGLARP